MARIRIAVVDTGLDRAQQVVAGIAIRSVAEGRIAYEPDWADRLGHGTAVAKLIRAQAPDADLLAVRIFGTAPIATADQLVGAIRWAISHGAQLINLSLGTGEARHAARLETACRLAIANGALVVAAGPLLPAIVPSALGIGAADLEPGVVRAAQPPLNLEACGLEDGGQAGSSFATARVTAMLARQFPPHGFASPGAACDQLLAAIPT